ncbi:hypothetical protein J437_LFUL008014 [Ladona fulva]|uniref:palmitoyl-protein hydrolase n=1 Tax=Ladona fulva TaxID=123851 RepID=A0A8K0P7N4_LADFU|nr:hypothetical protein J437_LFUL008014 [Ladona fulva]
MNLGRIVISKQVNANPSGSVIFLHGSGDTGNGVRMWIHQLLGKEMQFPHLRLLFPTAPVLPYTPMGGSLSNVWFDRQDICPEVPECVESINSSGEALKHLIQKEVEDGIPMDRIIIGGFSMGGAMAMHLAYRILPEVAGCFAISSFLNESSVVYESMKKNSERKYPPLTFMHGDADSLVPSEWGMDTFQNLKKLGVEGSFSVKKNVMHELSKEELLELTNWVNSKLPQS